jgi:hypothetical protein
MEELTETYETKIVQLKSEYEQSGKKLTAEIEELSKQLSETQMLAKSSKAKLQIRGDEQERLIKELQ